MPPKKMARIWPEKKADQAREAGEERAARQQLQREARITADRALGRAPPNQTLSRTDRDIILHGNLYRDRTFARVVGPQPTLRRKGNIYRVNEDGKRELMPVRGLPTVPRFPLPIEEEAEAEAEEEEEGEEEEDEPSFIMGRAEIDTILANLPLDGKDPYPSQSFSWAYEGPYIVPDEELTLQEYDEKQGEALGEDQPVPGEDSESTERDFQRVRKRARSNR